MDANTVNPPALTRHITKLWPRDAREGLIAAGALVQALRDSPGWDALTRVLDAEVEAIDRSLDHTHKALDHADYALQHGRRGGLRAIRDAADAIVDRAHAAQHEIDHENAAEPADS